MRFSVQPLEPAAPPSANDAEAHTMAQGPRTYWAACKRTELGQPDQDEVRKGKDADLTPMLHGTVGLLVLCAAIRSIVRRARGSHA